MNYVRTFLDYCLPAQLSPDNVPALARKAQSRYTIYTTRLDYERIAQSTAFAALQRLIEVSIELIDPGSTPPEGKYELKSRCYRAALKDAAQHGAAVVALNADIVLANGFVRTAISLLASGKRVIEVPGPRGLRDPIGHALLSDYRAPDGIAISIAPADLSALWTRHMHPQLAMHHVEGPAGAPFHPSHLYWAVRDEGVIIRGFHLYPIVVDPQDASIRFNSAIDDDLVGNLGLSDDQRHLAQNSRDLFCCELSPPDHYVGTVAARGDFSRYIDFYLSYSRHNIRNLEKEIIISGVDQPGPEWGLRRRQSAVFIRRIVRSYKTEQLRRRLREICQRMSMPVRASSRIGISVLRKIAPKPVKAAARAIWSLFRSS